MTRQTTSTFLISPRAIGPWADEQAWRLQGAIELVEGGSSSYLLAHRTSRETCHVRTDSVALEIPSPECLLDALVALLGLNFGSDRSIDIFRRSHNLVESEMGIELAPFWEFADEVFDGLVQNLTQNLKIGLVQLDTLTLADRNFLALAWSKGLQISTFGTPSIANE